MDAYAITSPLAAVAEIFSSMKDLEERWNMRNDREVDDVEWVMLSVAHVHFRPYPEMFGGILGSLESVLPPGFS